MQGVIGRDKRGGSGLSQDVARPSWTSQQQGNSNDHDGGGDDVWGGEQDP